MSTLPHARIRIGEQRRQGHDVIGAVGHLEPQIGHNIGCQVGPNQHPTPSLGTKQNTAHGVCRAVYSRRMRAGRSRMMSHNDIGLPHAEGRKGGRGGLPHNRFAVGHRRHDQLAPAARGQALARHHASDQRDGDRAVGWVPRVVEHRADAREQPRPFVDAKLVEDIERPPHRPRLSVLSARPRRRSRGSAQLGPRRAVG